MANQLNIKCLNLLTYYNIKQKFVAIISLNDNAFSDNKLGRKR